MVEEGTRNPKEDWIGFWNFESRREDEAERVFGTWDCFAPLQVL